VTVLAQIPAPPTDSPAGLLGWAVAAVLVGALALFKLREKERAAELTRLIADKASLETKVDLLQADKDHLQDKYTTEVRRTARSISLAREALSVRTGAPPASQDDDFEESTGVHANLNERARAEVDKLAREFIESTPPRQRMPSRPR